jgi:peptidoglycan/LPS O-acetylase OafA/YrhL
MRSAYLDIIRGLACMQVLLLHIAEAFFPAFATEKISDFTLGGLVHGSPLYLIYDGYTGVFVFFLLSGYVLTPSFDKDIGPHRLLAARWGRLLVPAFAACVFSFAIKWLLFDYNPSVKAAAISGSVFLQDWWQPSLDWRNFFKDSLINAIFLGYAETSALLTDAYLDSISSAFVAPLWTLSVEMHGSILVLLLVTMRRHSAVLYGLVLFTVVVVVIRSYYILFVIGHLLALARQEDWVKDKPTGAAIYLLVGAVLCLMGEMRTFALFEAVCEADLPFSIYCSGHIQKMIGSIILFYGLMISTRMQKILRGPVLEWLGTHSFPIYLAHWPILCGFGSLALVLTMGTWQVTPFVACAVAACVTLVLTMISAVLFRRIDEWGIGFSRWLRHI